MALFASRHEGIVGLLLNHSRVDKVGEEDRRILILLRHLAGLGQFLLHHIQPGNLGADLVLFGEFVRFLLSDLGLGSSPLGSHLEHIHPDAVKD